MEDIVYHIPALLEETIEGLNIKPGGVYVDVTMGGGGHTRAILNKLGPDGRLYGFDQDLDAIKNAPNDKRFQFVRSNFRYLKNWMHYYDIEGIDGLIADLGVSSHHLDDAERGFSFRFDAPLDMRMNQAGGKTAAQVLAEYSEEQLADIFYLYGEMRQARQVARAICLTRATRTIGTTQELVELLTPLCGRDKEKKDLARLFQALRIEVNQEMEVLKEMLQAASDLLMPGGRLAVLTYHSLEDRLVKNFIKAGNFEGRVEKDFYGNPITSLKAVNNKPIVASQEEVERNPRARSAKLRVGEKIED